MRRTIPGSVAMAVWMAATWMAMPGTLRADSGNGSAASPATAPATAPAAKPPTVDELLPKNKAPVDLEQKTIPEVLDFLAKTYGLSVTARTADDLPKVKITLKPDQPLGAREAINEMNDTLLVLGYTIIETVQGDPPGVVLTVVPTKRDAGSEVPVFYGNDPAQIPEGDSLRTQVFILKDLDPAKAKETIASVLGPRADVTLEPSTGRMIVTDTGAHVHTAAALLSVLEKQAGSAAPAAGGEK